MRHGILRGIGLALMMGVAAQVQALPTIFFDGSVTFTAGTGVMSVSGQITGSQDTSLTPDTGSPASTVSFSAILVSSGFQPPIFTVAAFTGPAGSPDLVIADTTNGVLLSGDIATLGLFGVNGSSATNLDGDISTSGGLLASEFSDPSSLLALQLNLSIPVSPTMFNADFTASIDGRVASLTAPPSVPEPSTGMLVLLGLTLVGLRLAARRGRI